MNLFDKYFLTARVFPILIFIAPFVAIAYFVFGFMPDYKLALSSVLMIALVYLIALYNREWGKILESRLFTKWGGKPTSILLRDSDDTIINTEKENIKLTLSEYTGYTIPSLEEENNSTEKTDEIYELYCKYLRNETRDKNKFPVIFDELINYGFTRNLLVLKKLAIILLLIIASLLVFYAYSKNWIPYTGIYISIGVVLVSILGWISISESRLKKYAFRYARILLDSTKHIK